MKLWSNSLLLHQTDWFLTKSLILSRVRSYTASGSQSMWSIALFFFWSFLCFNYLLHRGWFSAQSGCFFFPFVFMEELRLKPAERITNLTCFFTINECISSSYYQLVNHLGLLDQTFKPHALDRLSFVAWLLLVYLWGSHDFWGVLFL